MFVLCFKEGIQIYADGSNRLPLLYFLLLTHVFVHLSLAFYFAILHLSIIDLQLGIMLGDITSCFYIVEIDKNNSFRGMKLFQIMWMMKSIFIQLIICKYYKNIPPHMIERVTILFGVMISRLGITFQTTHTTADIFTNHTQS